MPGVHVVTDSACDLTAELAGKYALTIVPLIVRFGDETLLDRQDLSPEEFWRRCRDTPSLPETSAPAPGEFQHAYDAAADEGYTGILCVTISSKVSATYQSALTAAGSYDRIPVRVVDSRSVTVGQGLLAMAAAEDAAAGARLDELVMRTEDRSRRTRVYGVVDTLDHLQRGGRIGGAQALLGSILSIKPVIQVKDGAVAEESKQRTRSRALQYLVNKVKQDAPIERLAVANGNAADIDVVVSQLRGVVADHDPMVVDLGPAVGTHSGPGTIGVCYQVAAGSPGATD